MSDKVSVMQIEQEIDNTEGKSLKKISNLFSKFAQQSFIWAKK